MKNNNYPDFLIVGAAKSGTTSLWKYFSEHPGIFMPKDRKELNYLHLRGNESKREIINHLKKRGVVLPRSTSDYLDCFKNRTTSQVCGESTPSYLYYYEDTINNIKSIFPNWEKLKIIIILREPIDKIWSHYKFVNMYHLDPDKFNLEKSISYENSRLNDPKRNYLPDLFYVDNTSYYHQVKAYIDNFKYTKVVLLDDLTIKPKEVLKSLYSFLNIDYFEPNNLSEKFNKSRPIYERKKNLTTFFVFLIPRRLRVIFLKMIPKTLLKSAFKTIFKLSKEMPLKTQKKLAPYFKNEITKLDSIIDNDLSDWISKYDKLIQN